MSYLPASLIAIGRVDRGKLMDQAADDIISICNPLMNSEFECTWFQHSRTFANGKTFTLSTHPNWVHHYDEHLSGEKFELLHNVLDRGRPTVWSSITSPRTQDFFSTAKNDFNIANGLSIITHCPGFSDFFTFATHDDNRQGEALFLGNVNTLKKFIFSYKEQAAPIIHNASEQIKYTPRCDKSNKSPSRPVLPTTNTVNLEVDIKRFYIGDNYLTVREVQCIKAFAHGNTSEQTAGLLSISTATVKKHIENAMKKMQCHSKTGLVINAIKHGLIEIR